jgi:hypothetical protein
MRIYRKKDIDGLLEKLLFLVYLMLKRKKRLMSVQEEHYQILTDLNIIRGEFLRFLVRKLQQPQNLLCQKVGTGEMFMERTG